jgi:hypothetical protein
MTCRASAPSRRLLSFNPVTAVRELERAAAAGDADAGLRALSVAVGGDMASPGPAVTLLADWAVEPPADLPPGVLPPLDAPAADGEAEASAGAEGMGEPMTPRGARARSPACAALAAAAHAADLGLPSRVAFAARLLALLAAECRRCRREAVAEGGRELPAPPLTSAIASWQSARANAGLSAGPGSAGLPGGTQAGTGPAPPALASRGGGSASGRSARGGGGGGTPDRGVAADGPVLAWGEGGWGAGVPELQVRLAFAETRRASPAACAAQALARARRPSWRRPALPPVRQHAEPISLNNPIKLSRVIKGFLI